MRVDSSVVFCKLFRVVLLACSLLVSIHAWAVPVTVNYNGNSTAYLYGNASLTSFIPLGMPMSMSLTFNETFSDRTYGFSDNLGPVSGTMSIGLNSYNFNSYQPFAYSYDIPSGDVTWVRTLFNGSGPVPLDADFYGLFLSITPGMSLFDNPSLGFSWTQQYDDYSITNYAYVEFSGTGRIVRVNQVPEPATLALLGIGLAGLGTLRRRKS